MCCPHYGLLTFVKARFFVLVGVAKGNRINKKTKGPVQLLFSSVSVSHFKMVLFTKKKQFVCWDLCFLVNEKYKEKKSFSFVHKTTFWLFVRKNKSKCWNSVVLRLVLKDKQRQTKNFGFFFAGIALLSKQEKRSFF